MSVHNATWCIVSVSSVPAQQRRTHHRQCSQLNSSTAVRCSESLALPAASSSLGATERGAYLTLFILDVHRRSVRLLRIDFVCVLCFTLNLFSRRALLARSPSSTWLPEHRTSWCPGVLVDWCIGGLVNWWTGGLVDCWTGVRPAFALGCWLLL